MDAWNYILGYRNTLKSVFETWVVHIPFNPHFGGAGHIIISTATWVIFLTSVQIGEIPTEK